MIGTVDDQNRALVEIGIASNLKGPPVAVSTWIDTAFDGHLILSKSLIDRLDLETLAETEAVLADGSSVQLQTYLCYVE